MMSDENKNNNKNRGLKIKKHTHTDRTKKIVRSENLRRVQATSNVCSHCQGKYTFSVPSGVGEGNSFDNMEQVSVQNKKI